MKVESECIEDRIDDGELWWLFKWVNKLGHDVAN